MQLMPYTAKKYTNAARLPPEAAAENNLIKPYTNIALGAQVLADLTKHYGGFNPAIYAAYNAGESAVDGWLARRRHTDPLMWVELVPYSETKSYIKNVWRNYYVYSFLAQTQKPLADAGATKDLLLSETSW